MRVLKLTARAIIASLGSLTIEAELQTDTGIFTASVPAGLSAGKYEVKKVPAQKGVELILALRNKIENQDFTQETLDDLLAMENIGGNASLAVSAAFFKADKKITSSKTIPKLMLLLFEGGEHGNKNITAQEFMIIEDSVGQASEDFARLKYYLKENDIENTVGAEGGFSPKNFDNLMVLETIERVFPDKQIAIDVAECFESESPLDYFSLVKDYNIISLEDPYNDEQWDEWVKINNDPRVRGQAMIVGDDLTVTNVERIQKAVELKAISGIIIKPNQIGTITQAIASVNLAKDNGLKIIVSHRGEETNDSWIADFAVSVSADYVKFGGMDRGERVAKYNRLIELETK